MTIFMKLKKSQVRQEVRQDPAGIFQNKIIVAFFSAFFFIINDRDISSTILFHAVHSLSLNTSDFVKALHIFAEH